MGVSFLGARDEVLRVLGVLLNAAYHQGTQAIWAQANAMREIILLPSTTAALQTQDMAPLLAQFESLKRALDAPQPQAK